LTIKVNGHAGGEGTGVDQLIFGTSGWSYKEWVGPFYRSETRMLSFYTRYFRTAEINSTFYRYPTRGMVYGWLRSSPKDFVFSAKLPRIITHKAKLSSQAHVENHLTRFLELMDPLRRAGKLGPLLIQLPPSFSVDRHGEDLATFLTMLPEDVRFAVEFRHWSWMRDETWRMLRDHNVAYTIVDEPLLPPEVHVTADFAYFRWHGRGERPWYNYRYTTDELTPWIPKVLEVKDRVKEVYGYFNNHYHGYAVENCVDVLEMLGQASAEQKRIRQRVVKHHAAQAPSLSLEAYIHADTLDDIERRLQPLMGTSRFKRAQQIADADVHVEVTSDTRLEARVRGYVVIIDGRDRRLIHDCTDWKKRLGQKRLCKHVGKVLLSIPREQAKRVLDDLTQNAATWRFELPEAP
jgi:uncharacterized protein YecE (DUF72 family)